jgi:thiol:disulfide interchange protein
MKSFFRQVTDLVSHRRFAKWRFSLFCAVLFLALSIVLPGLFGSSAGRAEVASAPYSSRLEIIRLDQGVGPIPQGALLGIYWLTPVPGWYVYAHQPGPTGVPTTLQALLATDDQQYLEVLYPPGIVKEDSLEPGVMVETFMGATPLFMILPEEPGEEDSLYLHLRMLLCSDRSCWPVDSREQIDGATLSSLIKESEAAELERMEWMDLLLAATPGTTSTPFVRPLTPAASATVALEQPLEMDTVKLEPVFFQPGLEVKGLGKAMLLALLGGLILNLTPCVLPVVSLKLRGLIPDAESGDLKSQRKAFRDHNQLFALGILTFFLFLAFLFSFTGMFWGQLFQNPTTVIVLATLLLAMSMSLFGLFNLPVIDLKLGRKGDSGLSGEGQAYFTGMLATLLATPCSGPFLGGVFAWTLVQPPLVIAGVFSCVGLGMASPYFVVSFFPALVRFLPRPGNWTLYLERALGFVLLATCIYLLTFLPGEFLFPVLILFWVTGMAAWIWGGWTNLSDSALRRWSIRAGALVLVLAAGGWTLTAKPVSSEWELFTPELYIQAFGQDRMLLDFTADWCPNCKFLEKAVLSPGNISSLRAKYDLRLIKVDLTHDNPAGMELLRGLGSQSIPVVAIFERGEAAPQPLILRDLFTLGQLEQALATAFRE